jgi:hypothetical protein
MEELEILKDRLKMINGDLYWFWEEHLSESDPGRILVCWGQLKYMMWIKTNTEMRIEGIERELNQNAEHN